MTHRFRFAHATLIAAVALAASACSSPSPDAAAASPSSSVQPTQAAASAAPAELSTSPDQAASWSRVEDPSQVCMVNNQFMGAPQIPVEVDGKTYFGCCEMCKGRLQSDESARTAQEPGSGAAVDKASGYMAKNARGEVRYFASEQSLTAFLAR